MSGVLADVAVAQARETLREVGLGIVGAGVVLWVCYRALSEPLLGPPLPPLEVAATLGVSVTVVSAAVSRVAWRFRLRNARILAGLGLASGAVAIFFLLIATPQRFAKQCARWEGVVVQDGRTPELSLCVKGGVPGNAYLPGMVLRAPWTASLGPTALVALAGLSVLAALAFRDLWLLPSRVPGAMARRLQLEPASGLSSLGKGERMTVGAIQACGNATFWGEICGQIYPVNRTFLPGEWCARCMQIYQRCERTVDLKVVSLATADLETLNGLERIDTNAWPMGEPIPPEPQLSGRERWVVLCQIAMPEVLTVAQTLAVVRDLLPSMVVSAGPNVGAALALAEERASQVAAWFWFGPITRRLSFARPTRRAVLGIGTMRLLDIVAQAPGEEITLQLEVGLLPLEIRSGSVRVEGAEGPQNNIQALWVPVGPPGPLRRRPGAWIPRLEGDALRTWLSTERILPEDARTGSIPLPYWRHGSGKVPPAVARPEPGSLDLVGLPVEGERGEPIEAQEPGASISEWAWMEQAQIEWLRQRALVLTTREERRR